MERNIYAGVYGLPFVSRNSKVLLPVPTSSVMIFKLSVPLLHGFDPKKGTGLLVLEHQRRSQAPVGCGCNGMDGNADNIQRPLAC